MKLGARTAVWALALSSIPLLGMALLAFHTARSTLRAEIDHQLLAAARAELATVERFVGDAQTDLSTWSNLHIIQDVLNDDPDGEASRELARLAHQASSFTELLALNAAGKVVAATRGDYIGLELGDSIAHRQALSGRGYRSPVERSALIDQEAMTLAAPIRANQARDQVLGTLVGIIDWHEVSATLDELTVLGARQDRDRRLLLRDPARGAALYDTIGADPAAYAALPTEPGLTESTFDGRAYLIGTAVAPTDGDAPPWR
jgi:hypothetical protein